MLDYMADEGGKSDQQLLHGAEKYIPFSHIGLLICLAQACSLRPATALHRTASILLVGCSEPLNSGNVVFLSRRWHCGCTTSPH
jgi:hypothetical protein